MLDGLLGRGFISKCKSLIKLTKSRIDVLRRKRNAAVKFLKKDLADLLANGLDINAHGRAGGLLDELRLLWNLDFVEKSCDIVLKHLSAIQKQRECPEDCREAVSSLMFAASGFSELLELRDLRQMFHERYGDSLELFVNREFVENLSSKPFSPEKKVKLMEDIALEFSIKWDSQGFEQRMSRHNAAMQDQRKNYGSHRSISDKYKSVTANDGFRHDFPSIERAKSANDGLILHAKYVKEPERSELIGSTRDRSGKSHPKEQSKNHGSYHVSNDKYRLIDGNKTVSTGDRDFSLRGMFGNANYGHKSHGKEVDEGNKPIYDTEETFARKIKHENLFQGKQHGSGKGYEPLQVEEITSRAVRSSNSLKEMEKVEARSKHSGRENRENVFPPRESPNSFIDRNPDGAYAALKSKGKYKDPFGGNGRDGMSGNEKSTSKAQEEEMNKPKPYFNNALPPPYVKPNRKQKGSEKGASGYSRADFNGNAVPEDVSSHNRSNVGSQSQRAELESSHPHNERHRNHGNHQDESLPKRSSRRRHSKSSGHDDVGNIEDTGHEKRHSRSSRRKDSSRRGLQVLLNDEHYQDDEEERIIDNLLMHYSKKESYEDVKRKSKSRSKRHSRNVDPQEGEAHHNRSRNGSDGVLEIAPHPARSISLPNEQKDQSAGTKTFSRAVSFQADGSNAARHVHPKLPDYDDLAARFAALKGR